MSAKDKLLEKLGIEKSLSGATSDFNPAVARQEWVQSLESLLGQMREWMKPVVEGELIDISGGQTEISETDLGSYVAPTLILTTPRNHRVHIIPQERFVIGYLGRVQIRSGPQKVSLYRNASQEWLIGVRQFKGLETSELTEESFLDMVTGLLP